MYSALSPDKKLLAVSTSKEKIYVYDVMSKELRQELEGTGKMWFRSSSSKVGDSKEEDIEDVGKPSYTLISSISCDSKRGVIDQNTLILWDLDKQGRLLVEEERIDTSHYASQALAVIVPSLTGQHEVSTSFIESSSLHDDFKAALAKFSTQHRRRHNTTLKDAQLPGFGSFPCSHGDGKYLLYTHKNKTTQNGMREPDELPQVVVYDLDANKEIHRLQGATDYIAWSMFSPSNAHIATISWDGILRMYSASTGSLLWGSDPSGGQSWSGAFSPDSQYIVWSSKNGKNVQVHNTKDGACVATFDDEVKIWCRNFAWNPDGQQVALCFDRHAYVWRPFDGHPNGRMTQHFELKKDDKWRGFVSVQSVKWLEEGRKLCLLISDGTSLVWDTQSNAKELFKRPKGTQVAWTGAEGLYYTVHGDQEHDYYISVDGDGKVRYWRVSVPAFPSWWEKKAMPEKVYPETGKYVKVTKSERDAWAKKGADLWTAE